MSAAPPCATVTAVPPISRFGMIELGEGSRVHAFSEKPQTEGWMNAGYFVLNRGVFDYLGGDDCIFERQPLERDLAKYLGPPVVTTQP